MTEQTNSIGQNGSGEELFRLFRRVVKNMARLHHHGHGHGPGHGRHAQRHILSILRERGSLNQRDLMEMLNVRSASLSEILGKLERHGLISRERDEQDRRNFIITATEEGDKAFGEHESERREQAEQVFAALDADERASLARLLEKLAQSLEADEAARGGHGADDGKEGHGHGCCRHRHGHGPRGEHGPEGHEHHDQNGHERRGRHEHRERHGHQEHHGPREHHESHGRQRGHGRGERD